MIRALHELFSEAIEAVWHGIIYGIVAATALTVVFFTLKGLTGWASMLKAVVQ